MSLEIVVEEAADWSEEQAAYNLTYLDQRERYEEIQKIREIRGGGVTATEESQQEAAPAEVDPEAPPQVDIEVMTAEQVAEWVGDDPEKAAIALQLEAKREEPRKGLTARLERIAG